MFRKYFTFKCSNRLIYTFRIILYNSCSGKVSYFPVQSQSDQHFFIAVENYHVVRDDIECESDFNQLENCAERKTF